MVRKRRKHRTIYQEKREQAGISQEEAAIRINVSTRTMQFIEAGKREPSFSVAADIAELYCCEIKELLPETGKWSEKRRQKKEVALV